MRFFVNNPYTYQNSTCPWLMGIKEENDKNDEIIQVTDKYNNKVKCSSKYLWSLNIDERKETLNQVFNYYRSIGFPEEKLTQSELISIYNKLKDKNPDDILIDNNIISNSGSLGLNICRHFCADKFWSASDEKMMSIRDVFNNDELFINVLKNRMGWCLTNEGKSENNNQPRPYMFSITDKQIRTGIRNSGGGYGVSNFRPLISKFIYNKYLNNIVNKENRKPVIFDYSGGWGARCLSALVLGYDYIFTDPLTYDNIMDLYSFYKYNTDSFIKGFKSGSENKEIYKEILNLYPNGIDMCFSSPPYFKLEIYNKTDVTQCYNKYSEYRNWLEYYWKQTCLNCNSILKHGGYFGLVIKETFNKYDLADDMTNYLDNYLHYKLIDTYRMLTSQSHLSSKSKTGNKQKTSEIIFIYQKP